MQEVEGDEDAARSVAYAFVEDAENETGLDEQADAGLSRTDQRVCPASPNIQHVATDDATYATRCVLDRRDAELRVWIRDSGSGGNDCVVCGT